MRSSAESRSRMVRPGLRVVWRWPPGSAAAGTAHPATAPWASGQPPAWRRPSPNGATTGSTSRSRPSGKPPSPHSPSRRGPERGPRRRRSPPHSSSRGWPLKERRTRRPRQGSRRCLGRRSGSSSSGNRGRSPGSRSSMGHRGGPAWLGRQGTKRSSPAHSIRSTTGIGRWPGSGPGSPGCRWPTSSRSATSRSLRSISWRSPRGLIDSMARRLG